MCAHVGRHEERYRALREGGAPARLGGVPVSKQRDVLLRLTNLVEDHSYTFFGLFLNVQMEVLHNIHVVQSTSNEIAGNIDNVLLELV